MVDAEENGLNELPPTNIEEEQRIMFEQAGLMLERLARDKHNEDQEEKTVNSDDFMLKGLVSCKDQQDSCNKVSSKDSSTEDSSSEDSSTEESSDEDTSSSKEQIDKENTDKSLDAMFKNKKQELEAIKVETNILFKKLIPRNDGNTTRRGSVRFMLGKKVLENGEQVNTRKITDETSRETEAINKTNVDAKRKETVETDIEITVSNNEEEQIHKPKTEITENEVPNIEQNTERKFNSAETMLNKLPLTDDEEAIHTMFSSVQSKQNLLEEKMVALKASTESLKEQLEEEKQKLKQEIDKTKELEEILKNEKKKNEKQPSMLNEDDILKKMDMFKEYVYFTNCTMQIEMELKRKNYKRWLNEIAMECVHQLDNIQNNLSILRPMKDIVSQWNISSNEKWDLDLKSKREVVTNYNTDILSESDKEKAELRDSQQTIVLEDKKDENNDYNDYDTLVGKDKDYTVTDDQKVKEMRNKDKDENKESEMKENNIENREIFGENKRDDQEQIELVIKSESVQSI